jgi:hypothetical protein
MKCPKCGAPWPQHMFVLVDARADYTFGPDGKCELDVKFYDDRAVQCQQCDFDSDTDLVEDDAVWEIADNIVDYLRQ